MKTRRKYHCDICGQEVPARFRSHPIRWLRWHRKYKHRDSVR